MSARSFWEIPHLRLYQKMYGRVIEVSGWWPEPSRIIWW